MKQEFVQEGMRTYLKIEGDDLENVGDKMFSYQTIPGFVPMEMPRSHHCTQAWATRVKLH